VVAGRRSGRTCSDLPLGDMETKKRARCEDDKSTMEV
jgi:hypothetical protein